MRRALIAFTALVALTAPASAAGLSMCQEPYGPVLPDAATVTLDQLHEAKALVLQFIKDSDSYQSCILAVMSVKTKDEKLSPEQLVKAQRLIDENQKDKIEIGAEYNALAKAVAARGGK